MRLLNLMICFCLVAFVGLAVADSYQGKGCVSGVPVGKISFEGLKHTNKRVVMRELALKPGVLYSDSLFYADARRLESLDLFSEIRLECEPGGKVGTLTGSEKAANSVDAAVLENSVSLEKSADSAATSANSVDASNSVVTSANAREVQNVVIHFTEIFPFIPAPAGKKTDQDGWMLGGALAYLNAFGDDIRAELQYRTSVSPWFESNEYALYLSSPWLFDFPLDWNIEFLRTDSYDELRSYQAASFLTDVDLKWKFYPPFALLATVAYRRLDDFGNVPELGAGLVLDKRDAPLDTRHGFYSEFSVTGVGGWLDSKEEYIEYLLDSRVYFTFSRLISGASAFMRLRSGDVMFFDRLHHGGANTFRGSDADSLRHGENEILLNLEERFVLMERKPFRIGGFNLFYGIQLVAGLDGSILFDTGVPGSEDFSGAIYGGIHLLIPALERIRVEVGYSPDTNEPKIFVGLYEKSVSQRWRTR